MVKKRKNTNKKKRDNILAENIRLLNKLRSLSSKDPLTGTYNYPYFIERLNIELKHAKTYKFPLSIIMIDIDYFKSVNDTYGHRVGNKILKEFAHYLKRFARASDAIIRYAGSEFVILSLETDKEGAVALGERICENIQRRTFDAKKNKIKLKVSIGITSFPEDGIDAVSELVDAADKAVRDAKEGGGNRTSVFESAIKRDEKIIPKKGKDEIKDLKSRLEKAGKKLDQALLESIYAFAKAIEARDHYTGGHAEKMITIVRDVARELGLSKKKIADLEHAAVLHDLGKIGIDDKILRKKGKLTKKEYEEIKKHPRIGAEIVRSIHFLKDVVPLILYHHERYDGLGYTSGLKGKDIPLSARILAIADVYQALISDRPYRKAYAKKEALAIIREAAGKQFDPQVVKALFKVQKKKRG